MSLFAILGLNPELLVIALIALLFFGNRLPNVMRSLGQSVTEFKKGMEGIPEDDSNKTEPPKKVEDQSVAKS